MKNNSILVIALLAATALSAPTTAQAACPGTVANGESVAGPCVLGVGQSVNINAGGSVTNGGGNGISIGNDAAGSITNAGTINGSTSGIRQTGPVGGVTIITNEVGASILAGTHAINIDDGVITNGIVNNGTIDAGVGSGIRLFKATIQNGSITNGNTGSIMGNHGIELQSGGVGGEEAQVSGDINNNGRIEGDSNGILLDSATLTGDINNNSGATITATNQHGVWLTNNANNARRASVDDIINRGTIRTNGALGDAILIEGSEVLGRIDNQNSIISGHQGIRVDRANGQNSSVAEGIINAGTIQSANEGIMVNNSSTITTDITNNGTINSGGAGIVVSRSTVTGDVINNASGSITSAGHGIRVTNDGNPTRPSVTNITNAGSISTNAGGIGISLDTADVNGNVLNSGTINADGDGISVVDATVIDANLTNSNTIASANGHGIYIDGATVSVGNIVNGTGASITAANGSALMINDATTGVITNSGTLSGDYAINISTAAGSHIVNNTGRLDGAIKIERTTLNLNNGSMASGKIGGANGIVNINTDLSTAEEYGVDDGTLAEVNLASGKTFTVLGGTSKTFDTDDFNNDGALKIVGNPSSSAVMTVTGDYTQGATGVLNIDAQFPTIHSALDVTGTANFDPDARIHLNITGNEFDFAGGAVVQDVVSAGTLNASTFNVTDSSYLYNFNAVVQGQTVDLHSLRDATNSVTGAVTAGGNKAAQGASQALEEIISGAPSPEMQTVINALGSLGSAEEIADAVSQTLPTLTGGSTTAILQTMGATGQVIQARNSQNTGLSSGDGIIGDDNVWIKPFGTWSNQNEDDGVVGYDADTYGVIGGYDNSVSDDMRLGIALSYARTDVESDDSRNKMDIDSYQASLYGSYAMGPKTEASFQLGGGYNSADSRRMINFGGLDRVADGDISGYAVQAGAGVGHYIDIGPGTTFTPSARVDYALIRNQSYTETGAGGLNLDVKSQTTDQLIPSVSGKVDYEYVEGLSLALNAGVGYDVLNERNSVTANYVGGGSAFVTEGLEPSPWVVRSGVGLTYNATDDMDITIRYDREDRGEFDAQTASARLRTQF